MDGSKQDIVFKIGEKPHGWFQRRGDDLHYSVDLSLSQAKKGVKVKIPTLDGREVTLETGASLNKNKKQLVKGEGMPKRKAGVTGSKGDMVVEFRVATPA